MKLEAMIPVMKGEIPLKAHAHRADDILTSIRIAKEFGVKLTLDHCTDGSVIAEELAKEGYPAFVGPSLGGKSKVELINKAFSTPADLARAGVNISIITDAPVIPLQHLPMCAGLASNAGLPYEDAWRAITINPARALEVDDRVGSLEAGKDGDVVIWTADPIKSVGAESYVTIVNGKIAYSK
jgi:imidazolonepropionase-like amidohydrolase